LLLIFVMAEKKPLSPSKYELLRDGYDESSEVGEEREDITYDSFYPRVYNRYSRRFPVICIGICLSCFILSLIILGVSGILLRIRLNQSDSTGAISSSTPNTFQTHHGIWVEEAPDDYPCGHTPAEAVARGCKFETLITSWQHPDCFDEELNTEIVARYSPLPFYWSDRLLPEGEYPTLEMLHVIDPEDMPYHEGPFWTTREYHTWHCSYAWMKMHRAVEHGRKLVSRYLGGIFPNSVDSKIDALL
jgi:hypothetical protein